MDGVTTIENTLVLRSINFIYHQSTCMLIGCDLEYPSILLDPTIAFRKVYFLIVLLRDSVIKECAFNYD